MNRVAVRPRPAVVILGGGFTGAAVAYHLANGLAPGTADIVVLEPREALGAGLAYSTREPSHRINVPAAKMSLVSDDPAHFSRWLAASGLLDNDAGAVTAAGDAFPQRAIFGRYVAEGLAPLLRSGRIRHERDRAVSARRDGGRGFAVQRTAGPPLRADVLVVATTHPLPAVPAPLRPLEGSPRFIADPYDPTAFQSVAAQARVLVVGNGLTAADVVALLDRRGHEGCITALSRHGFHSRGHARHPAPPHGDFATEPSATAPALLRRIRQAIAAAETEGIGWHAVLDAVRSQGPAIWLALPEGERRRVVRHLRSAWDAHRFRIAPQVEAVLDRRAAAGTFRSVAASLGRCQPTRSGIAVELRRRHARASEVGSFDVVVNTTGPAHGSVVTGRGPIRSLCEAGLLRLDPVGLGLDTARDGRAIGADGRPVDGLYVAGPLARGTFGELMGLPEVTRYAEFIAGAVAETVAAAARHPGRLVTAR